MQDYVWLPLAKALPKGHKLRWKHCGKDAAADIRHNLDGYSMYCHRCGTPEFVPLGVLSFAERMELRKLEKEAATVLTRATVRLPADFTLDIPANRLSWLLEASITPYMARKVGIGYTPKYQRIVLPVYDADNNLVFTQNRAVIKGQQPKYLNPSVNREAILYFAAPQDADFSTVVVVEDILSAIRVGEFIPTYSLLGTKVSLIQANLLIQYAHILIWLDPDKAGVDGTKKLKKLAGLVSQVTVVTSDADPKNLTNQEIKDILSCHANQKY